MRSLLGLALSVLALVGVLLAPAPAGLTPEGQRVLAVVAMTVVLWIAEPVPPAVTGLVAILLLSLVGGYSLSQALYGFSQPLVYFLFGALVLGLGTTTSGLAERAASYIIARSRRSGTLFYAGAMLLFVPLAFVLPSAATRGAILTPVYDRALALMGLPRGAPTAKATMLGLAILNRLASTALLTGGLVPVTAAALLGGFSWTRWFVLMAVPYYTLIGLGALLIYLLYHRSPNPVSLAVPAGEASLAPNRGFSRSEARALAIALGVSLLWVTDSIHHLNPAVPALLGAIIALSPRIGVLDWSALERGMAWSIIFVLAASLSLANALVTSGASAWLAQGLTRTLSALTTEPLLLLLLLMAATGLIRMGMPSLSGFLPILIPVVLAFAQQVGLNPLLSALAVVIVGDSIVVYAAQGAASSLLAYERGHFSSRELLTAGLGTTVISFAVVFGVALPYWALVGERLRP